MSFIDTWQQLDEIYDVVDFNSTGTAAYESGGGLLYHFYQDLSDLVNSLKTGIIYSTKNDKEANKAQYDYGIEDGMAYVCMTNTLDGKNYMTKKFKRPFGLSFKNDRVNGLCKDGEFIRSFSAFGAKGDYKKTKSGMSLLANTKERGHNPFYIYSIGCLPPSQNDAEQKLRYFVCGGQGTGTAGAWSSQIFYDEGLYKELKHWFETNYKKGEEYQQRMYYHFVDGHIGNTTKTHDGTSSGLPIEVDGNLNTGYRARRDFDKAKKNEKATYGSTISFKMSSDFGLDKSFIEVLGYGPVDVKENGKVLLKFTFVNPNAVAGYQGPLLFGKQIDDNGNGSFAKASTPVAARGSSSKPEGEEQKIKSQQYHLVANQELFDKLCDVFNENEYRIYLRNSRDLRFSPADVETIVLPEKFTLAAYKDVINIDVLVDYLNPASSQTINFKSVDELIDSGVLTTTGYQQKKGRRQYSNYAIKLVQTLADLLDRTYGDVSVELIPETSSKETTPQAKAVLGDYLKTGEAGEDNEFKYNEKTKKFKTKDKARKLVSYWPDLAAKEPTTGEKNEATVLAPLPIPVPPSFDTEAEENRDWNKARIGSEVILTAQDESGQRYVLFVYKSKSQSFMELPGGGFDGMHQVSTEESFKNLLHMKLRRKCNIMPGDISTPVDTGYALVLNEEGVAKSDKVRWHWSYYRLYTAELKHKLTAETLENLGYTFDNTQVEEALKDPETGISVQGYRAHLRWVPLDSIELNRAVADRYSNIFHLIK